MNIKKDGVADLGLEIGPWLKQFKQALFNHKDPNSEFEVEFPEKNSEKKKYILGDLTKQIALITPGQKVTYITDVVYNTSNLKKIVLFAQDADHLFIEAAFLEKDRELARNKFHLTARQAGSIAQKAGVKQFTLFHFSPRYMDRAHLLQQEASKAFENKGI